MEDVHCYSAVMVHFNYIMSDVMQIFCQKMSHIATYFTF